MAENDVVTGKDLLKKGLEEVLPPNDEYKSQVDFESFTEEENILLEKELNKWKDKLSETFEKEREDIKRRIGLLIKSEGVNNVNKKLSSRKES